MLSFHVKFVQTDRRTIEKQYAPDLSIQGHKNLTTLQRNYKYDSIPRHKSF